MSLHRESPRLQVDAVAWVSMIFVPCEGSVWNRNRGNKKVIWLYGQIRLKEEAWLRN